ncbi:MAG: AGE family epimerase/isomerase, partial [bacterium]
VAAQELRKATDDPICTTVIDGAIAEIEKNFLKPEFKCLLENVGPYGEFYDTPEGRLVCPGHSLEAGWFILAEARHRNNDSRLIELGTRIIDWSFDLGWDEKFGGILYYTDAKKLPCVEYWHDMKFWWPHNEAIIAALMAFAVTKNQKYAALHDRVHDWAYRYFPDPVHGEWFGYLHNDGSLSTRVKGSTWKGPFHLPRMQLYCWKLLEEMNTDQH